MLIEFDSDRGKIKGQEYNIISKLNDKVYYVLASEGYYDSDDAKFFFDKLKDFMEFLEDNEVLYFGKLGGGVIYPFFKDEDKEKKREILRMINRMGGKPGEYGIGVARKHIKEASEKKIIRRVKMRHDPFGKLNKNKIIDEDFKSDRMGEESPLTSPPSIKKEKLKTKEQLDAHHLRPIGREEIEEIKPLIGEEALELIEELKTPEEKMGEFIEKVELIDQSKQEPESEKEGLNFEIKSRLQDYESTYKSELIDKRKKEIEKFAKNVAHNIIHPKSDVGEKEKESEKSEKETDSSQKDSFEEQKQGGKSDTNEEKKDTQLKPDDSDVEKRLGPLIDKYGMKYPKLLIFSGQKPANRKK